ncbi:hypothetical protein [Leptospira alstonii]|uniref:Uncharacterized protein n=2 Tax=Leptospira alstonii TaxID=28452 RepID=M6D0N1_9LEPT|nr:hypothetical protein [Leptospira alstonii]EMJ94728.1 hypothetical protein LEP1GSC194_1675 [Leptospira alstonii serovar Sichuan str. 79601]EQA80381.1 hypothetical protein LEP1GSC193_0358 [Leptospira alstonii serovar Pingchang str. 80-412]
MKSFAQEPSLKRVLQKIKNLNETELTEVEAVVDSLLNAKFESFMNEFAHAVGLDRPLLTLVKKGRRRKAKKD